MFSQLPDTVALTLGFTTESPGDPENTWVPALRNSDSTGLACGPGLAVNLGVWLRCEGEQTRCYGLDACIQDTVLTSPVFTSEQVV